MPNPHIDEKLLVETLAGKVDLNAVDRLQACAFLAIVDSYDRKIERDPFIAIVTAALGLHSLLDRLQAVQVVGRLLDAGTLDQKQVRVSRETLLKRGEQHRRVLLGHVENVRHCRLEEDTLQ